MKLETPGGRILLHVTKAERWNGQILYTYTGEGCGGLAPLASLQQTIDALRRDAPRAKLSGVLPAAP